MIRARICLVCLAFNVDFKHLRSYRDGACLKQWYFDQVVNAMNISPQKSCSHNSMVISCEPPYEDIIRAQRLKTN